MQSFLLVVELIVATALIIFVLLQRSEGGALGIGGGGGGGGMGGLFSPRGAGDVLSRTTAILAAIFFLVCIALNLYALHGGSSASLLRDSVPAAAPEAPVLPLPTPTPAPVPTTPQVPTPN